MKKAGPLYPYLHTKKWTPTPIHGGFALTHWNGSEEVEQRINDELGVTIRCIPLKDLADGPGTCPFSGEPSPQRVVWSGLLLIRCLCSLA